MAHQQLESQIPLNCEVQRLDIYLARRFTYLSRSQWQKEIKNSNVSVNNQLCTQEHKKVKPGDFIKFTSEPVDEPPVDSTYSVLYEDEYFIAIDKSGDIPVHAAGRYRENTLLSILHKDLKTSLFTIHRLDRETSGVILFAKSSEAASILQKTLSTSTKEYYALVHGRMPLNNVTCTIPIGPAISSAIRKKRQAYDGAPENAVSHFLPEKQNDHFTLVKVIIETGRMHQIRAHLHALGYPIVGDKMYGRDEQYYLEFIETGLTKSLLDKLILRRCALHAHQLSFKHPVTGCTICITAPLPEIITQQL